jgi:hypothetical protein
MLPASPRLLCRDNAPCESLFELPKLLWRESPMREARRAESTDDADEDETNVADAFLLSTFGADTLLGTDDARYRQPVAENTRTEKGGCDVHNGEGM